jgi:hypothetical protein
MSIRNKDACSGKAAGSANVGRIAMIVNSQSAPYYDEFSRFHHESAAARPARDRSQADAEARRPRDACRWKAKRSGRLAVEASE